MKKLKTNLEHIVEEVNEYYTLKIDPADNTSYLYDKYDGRKSHLHGQLIKKVMAAYQIPGIL